VSAAFDAVFGVFVVLMVGLAVVSVRWAVRRDRVARAARSDTAAAAGGGDGERRTGDPTTTGPPRPGHPT
jgi:hypothetical protein